MTAPEIWGPVPGSSNTGATEGYATPLTGSAVADANGDATITLRASPANVDILVAFIAVSAIGSGSGNPAVIVYDAVEEGSGYFDSGRLSKPGPATVGWYDPPRLIPAGHPLICAFTGLTPGDLCAVRVEYTITERR